MSSEEIFATGAAIQFKDIETAMTMIPTASRNANQGCGDDQGVSHILQVTKKNARTISIQNLWRFNG